MPKDEWDSGYMEAANIQELVFKVQSLIINMSYRRKVLEIENVLDFRLGLDHYNLAPFDSGGSASSSPISLRQLIILPVKN